MLRSFATRCYGGSIVVGLDNDDEEAALESGQVGMPPGRQHGGADGLYMNGVSHSRYLLWEP